MSKKIYIAGALFTPGQRGYLERIDKICKEEKFTTYLPHRDAGLFTRADKEANHFFERDVKAIDDSDIIIATLNGLEIDAGTSWEMGYAFSKNKIIIGILEDTRIFDKKQLNPMISGSTMTICNSLSELKKELTKIKRNDNKVQGI